MKLSPPGSLRVDRERLMQDVRDRLAERMPGIDEATADPTDPGWMLVEQATWLVEQLSSQLDRYPLAVLQQFLNLVGAKLEPAVPALGVVVVEPREQGDVIVTRERPADWRFFTPQTEERDPIEFVPAESRAPVRPLAVAGAWWWDGQQLFEADGVRLNEGEGAAGTVLPTGPLVRSAAFDRERVEYRLVATDTETLLERLEAVIQKMSEGASAWLLLSARREGDSEVVVEARVDPAAALIRAAGGPVAPGGDLLVPWAPVEGSTWTPPVRFAASQRLPLRLRNAEPMPGPEDGTILIRGLPASLPLGDLLVPSAAPLPGPVVEAIWRAVRRLDSRLSGLRPQVRRVLEPSIPAELPPPDWVVAVLSAGAWARLAGATSQCFVHLVLPPRGRGRGTLRVALQWATPTDVASLQAWALDEGGLVDPPIGIREAWCLPVPSSTEAQGLDHVQALDIAVLPGHRGVLLALPGQPRAVLPNALMVLNAPLVPDGREILIERAVPEAASLLEEDVVGPDVLERLAQQPVGHASRRVIEALPLARFSVQGEPSIEDFEGIDLDSTSGHLIFNAPDAAGQVRELRPRTPVTLDWYRRTDGTQGEVEAGAIRYVEQAPSVLPRLLDVYNPAGTWFGSARESEEDARERMFAPTADLPVVPGDWERLVLRELGARARGWVVRCWGHPERALLSTTCWPPADPESEDETRRMMEELVDAGPETLLVVLGPKDRVLSAAELEAARRVVDGLVQRVRRRLPAIQRAVVTRLWPLSMRQDDAGEIPPLPCFSCVDMRGTLVDPQGLESEVPSAALLLNAAVVRLDEVEL